MYTGKRGRWPIGGESNTGADVREELKQTLTECFRKLAHKLTHATDDAERVASKASSVWEQEWLYGHDKKPTEVLGPHLVSESRAAVSLHGVRVFMVCPHHLTIANGTADVTFLPQGRLIGLGRVAELIKVCTRRLVLQEDAVEMIAASLSHHLGCPTMVRIRAQHPCLALAHPETQDTIICTERYVGPPGDRVSCEKSLYS